MTEEQYECPQCGYLTNKIITLELSEELIISCCVSCYEEIQKKLDRERINYDASKLL